MPLSRAKNKERMRLIRATCVQPSVRPDVQPSRVAQSPVRRKLEEAGLNLDGNRISNTLQSKSSPLKEETSSRLPICNEHNFRQFRPGERVLMKRGNRLIETVIPELDADGNALWGE